MGVYLPAYIFGIVLYQTPEIYKTLKGIGVFLAAYLPIAATSIALALYMGRAFHGDPGDPVFAIPARAELAFTLPMCVVVMRLFYLYLNRPIAWLDMFARL